MLKFIKHSQCFYANFSAIMEKWHLCHQCRHMLMSVFTTQTKKGKNLCISYHFPMFYLLYFNNTRLNSVETIPRVLPSQSFSSLNCLLCFKKTRSTLCSRLMGLCYVYTSLTWASLFLIQIFYLFIKSMSLCQIQKSIFISFSKIKIKMNKNR